MNVYILVHHDIEHSEILGVFATREAAEREQREKGRETIRRLPQVWSVERSRAVDYESADIEEYEVRE